MSNILQAIANIVDHPIPDILNYYKSISNNRINQVGDALEAFIKDAFANTISEVNFANKSDIYSETFSWVGNSNNIPDLILKNGDAVEVKKIDSLNSQLALNSSYPKSKLLSEDPMIASDCRTCEEWIEKDIIYAIGVFKNKKLHLLWMIYGDCYAAKADYYQRIKDKISIGVHEIQDVEFSETKELGRVNKVDPLGITYLRIRGMWGIDNPIKVYDYLPLGYKSDSEIQIISIISETKYLSLSKESRIMIESISKPQFKIQDSKILSPNNPAKKINVKIISYAK